MFYQTEINFFFLSLARYRKIPDISSGYKSPPQNFKRKNFSGYKPPDISPDYQFPTPNEILEFRLEEDEEDEENWEESAMGDQSSIEDELDELKDWKTFVFDQYFSV